jgi:hypothetical protein
MAIRFPEASKAASPFSDGLEIIDHVAGLRGGIKIHHEHRIDLAFGRYHRELFSATVVF